MGELTESSTPQTVPPRPVPFREDCWTEDATSTLVDAWGRRYLELNRGNLRQKDWQEVADAVNAVHGHTKKTRRTDVQCKNRIDTLKKKYKVEKARVSDSNGAVASSWPFFPRLDVLIGSAVAAAAKKVPPATPTPTPISPPLALPLPYRKPPSLVAQPVVLPQKRPLAADDSYFRRNYSAMAAAAAAAEDQDGSEELDSSEQSGEGGKEREGEGMRRLARAIERFGEMYQRVEGEKQRQMIELEKQRMEFAKDLEVQRMQLFMDTQVQLEKIKQAKRSGSDVNLKNAELMSLDKITLHNVKAVWKRARYCNWKKDFLYLLFSYPMKSGADQADLFLLRDKFINLNRRVKLLPPVAEKKVAYKEILVVLDGVERCLDKFDLDFKAYYHDGSTGPAEEVGPICGAEQAYEWLIDSAIHQILPCIMGGKLKVIGIAGHNAEMVTKALEELQEITSMFEVVIRISLSQYHTISEVRTSIVEQMHCLVGTDISLPLDEALKPYKFLLFLHHVDQEIDLYDLKIPDHGCVVLTTKNLTTDVYEIMPMDLAVRMEDHLLPWTLFSRYVGGSFSKRDPFTPVAVQLIEACHRHLLAVVVLARALKPVNDVDVWKCALQELTSSSNLSTPVEGMSEVMVRVLKFVWDRENSLIRHCIKHCTAFTDRELTKTSLVSCWIKNDLIDTEVEGKDVVQHLFESFLLEEWNCRVRMREEIRDVLLSQFIPQLPQSHPCYINLEGLGLSEAPEAEAWGFAKGCNLNNNQLSQLPENPNCRRLVKLFLQKNNDLTEIPSEFFEHMPVLQVLDLSYTSIKSLPASISRLFSLQELFLRGCELFMELPPEIGALLKLKVLDLEATKVMYLPEEVLRLRVLECLKVSLYRNVSSYRESNQISKRIPTGLLAGLYMLEAVSIDVNPEDEEWIAEVEDVINELVKLRRLTTLKLYLPEVGLLKEMIYVPNFKLTVGLHKERIMSCLPLEVEEEFEKQECYIRYVNGKDIPTEIQNALKYTSAFFLERHWTAKKLSEFGIENMVELKFCLLTECNELQTIIDGGALCLEGDHKCESGVDTKKVLESLEYLGIRSMMNLRSIWEGPIRNGCLSKLKSLALHDCPNLTTIFTTNLLGNLDNLEELTVEDCPKINSLVSPESSSFEVDHFLPRLKKISLLDLPELVSISSGLCIALKLERITIYACPMLESLSPMELPSNDLKVIKGEIEWWNSLMWLESMWSRGRKDYMASIFVELKRDATLMDQLA